MSTIVKYDNPDLPRVGAATRQANTVVVDDQTTYEIATTTAIALKQRRDEIEAERKKIVDPINKAKDAVQALFNPVLADYDGAIKIVKIKMSDYANEQERIRAKAQAEAAAAAEAERARLAAAAAKAAVKGQVERAAELTEQAALVSAPTLAPAVGNIGGTAIRRPWKARVVDKAALVAFVATHPEYLNLLEVDQSACNKLAAAFEGKLAVAGIETYQDSIVAVRA